jgi:hypothetical protein
MAPAFFYHLNASKHWETNEGPQPKSFPFQVASFKQQASSPQSFKLQAASFKPLA